ncbi:fimbrial protein [Salmonella enterica]|nr:fimbrial protein [Salmonella enterica]
MNKSIIASVLALGLVSGMAHAAGQTGEVQFIGAVTQNTCDIVPEIDGSLSKNVVDLGTVAPGVTGDYKNFALKAKDPTQQGCVDFNGKTANVAWASAAFNADGLGYTSGTATDAVVKLETVNAKANAEITSANNQGVEFNGSDLTAGNGFKFKAALKSGNKIGDFRSAAAFTVSYK